MNQPTPIYVATNLIFHKPTVFSPDLPSELNIDDTPFRLLDPAYYAWLRSRMEKAKQAHKAGRLDAHSFDLLRSRFNELHDRAIALFGEDALVSAVRSLDPKNYQAPTRCNGEHPRRPDGKSPSDPCRENGRLAQRPSQEEGETPNVDFNYRYPGEDDPALPFIHPVRTSAIRKVREIEKAALTAGWSPAELYQNRGRFRFPYGQDYGAVCFIGEDQQFGAVTEKSLELVYPDCHSLFFRRRDQKHLAIKQSPAQTKEETNA